MIEFMLEGYNHRISIPFESLEKSFEIQEWCEENLGPSDNGSWAQGYAGDTEHQDWFFKEGRDAMLFKLRWA